MGKHKLPAIANRLRRGRCFDSAWFAEGPGMYATMLQKDLLLSKTVWSFVTRSSRSTPKPTAKDVQQKAEAAVLAAAALAKAPPPGSAPAAGAVPPTPPQPVPTRDFPNFRVGRIFMQHLPYKSIASTFAYAAPTVGPQAKYGLFQAPRVVPPRPPGGGPQGGGRGPPR